MLLTTDDLPLDPGIRRAVEVLNAAESKRSSRVRVVQGTRIRNRP
jgi:hypothetical protein